MFISQRFAAISFFTYAVFYMIRNFFSHIGAVSVYYLVIFSEKFGKFIAVMYIC